MIARGSVRPMFNKFQDRLFEVTDWAAHLALGYKNNDEAFQIFVEGLDPNNNDADLKLCSRTSVHGAGSDDTWVKKDFVCENEQTD